MITDEKLELLDKIYTASNASKNAYANACHFALGAIPELVAEIRRIRGIIYPMAGDEIKAFNDDLDSPPKDIPVLRELLTTDPLSGTPDGVVE